MLKTKKKSRFFETRKQVLCNPCGLTVCAENGYGLIRLNLEGMSLVCVEVG